MTDTHPFLTHLSRCSACALNILALCPEGYRLLTVGVMEDEFTQITQTKRGLGSNGKEQQERDGYMSASEVSVSASDPNVCREGRIATGPVFENSARGGYVGEQSLNCGDGRERALSPKTGYVPAEEYRQVPSPIVSNTQAVSALQGCLTPLTVHAPERANHGMAQHEVRE